jgi:hypothetical protein
MMTCPIRAGEHFCTLQGQAAHFDTGQGTYSTAVCTVRPFLSQHTTRTVPLQRRYIPLYFVTIVQLI